MKTTLDSHELLILLIIVSILSIVLAFFISNFGNHVEEQKITTFNNPQSSVDPVIAPSTANVTNGSSAVVPPPTTCGIVRTL